MENDQKQLEKKNFEFWITTIGIGVVFLISVFLVSMNSDMEKAHNSMKTTLNYVKSQCSMYARYNDASITKSTMRVMENTQQIVRNLEQDNRITCGKLEEYAREQRLTGIFILNEDGSVVCEYHKGAYGPEELRTYIQKETVLDVAEYPEKTYAHRIEYEDGSYIDLAANGRIDKKGVVIGYYHTPAEYAKNYSLTLQNLLYGYHTQTDGTIIVTDGSDITASNDTSLAGRAVSENALLEGTSHVRNAENPFYVKDASGKSYIGNMEKTQDFYIYIFLPVVQVYDMLRVNMLCALLVYVCMILILYAIKRRTDQQYQEIQQQRENEYRIRLMESEKKAERANMAKTEFLQRMSHDIRTPINGIRGMIEVANHYADDSEKQMECRKKIWEASGFLLELINEVLDMGKLESGEIVLEERPFSFKKILYEVIDVVEKQAKESGIEMIIHPLEVEHWYLIGSPMYVKRLLMNIMSNAVKYNKKNGKIFITCREYDLKEDHVTIEFICEDTGIGMSPEFQQHLFEPFAQEQSGARSAYGGTGLGMSITKSIAEKMNGSITFESEQGVGTTFHLRIPFIIDKESDIEEKNEKEEEVSLNGITVLIAEDNELNMEIAEFMLQNAGATVIKASDGQDAVDRFVESEPGQIDIILMDIMMPVMDGLMATGRIRTLNRPDAQSIPIIAMTANAFMEDRIQALNAGMDEHLTKPLESAVLIRTIAEFVRKS